MSELNVEELQRQLQEKIEALDKQRKEEMLRIEAEKSAWISRQSDTIRIAELERKAQIEEAERQEAERTEAFARRDRELAKREHDIEMANNAAQEAKQSQESKLKWLQEEIAKQEFIEEQHRKAVESTRIAAQQSLKSEATTDINVDHPTAPDNKGNAVAGPDGNTPDTPLMSTHLKQILRQAKRTY